MVVKEFLPQDPQIHRIWKKIKKITLASVTGLTLLYGAWDSFYTIKQDSNGVEQTFGQYKRTTTPGLHFKLPFIEKVTKVPIQQVQREEFGFRTVEPGVNSKFLSPAEIEEGIVNHSYLQQLINETDEPGLEKLDLQSRALKILQREYLQLTGDLGLADIEWAVQYDIKNPADYLFNIKDVKKSIRDCSISVMRRLIGNGSIDEAILLRRDENQAEAKKEIQELLDNYRSGVRVIGVFMQATNPPYKVRAAFDEVNSAMQKKARRINEAMGAYNTVIPKAKGEAEATIKKAEGYALERINRAKGDVSKFEQQYAAYALSPDITRQRMYFETMGKVLSEIPQKWVIEQKGAEGGILQKLDLNPTSLEEKVNTPHPKEQ